MLDGTHEVDEAVTNVREAVRLGDLTPAALETLQRRFAEVEETGPTTGLIDLDAMLGPFRPGTINVVGSRPSAGRTTLVLGAALRSARAVGPVLMVSSESTPVELTLRAIGMEASVDGTTLRNGRLNKEMWRRVGTGIGRCDLPLFVEFGVHGIATLRGCVERLPLIADRLTLIVIDGVDELVQHEVDAGTPARTVIRDLRSFARQVDSPLLVTSVLLGQADLRVAGRPVIADLRFDGAFEDVADTIVLLHPPARWAAADDTVAITTVDVVRNRFGPTGTARLALRHTIPMFAAAAPVERDHDDDTETEIDDA